MPTRMARKTAERSSTRAGVHLLVESIRRLSVRSKMVAEKSRERVSQVAQRAGMAAEVYEGFVAVSQKPDRQVNDKAARKWCGCRRGCECRASPPHCSGVIPTCQKTARVPVVAKRRSVVHSVISRRSFQNGITGVCRKHSTVLGTICERRCRAWCNSNCDGG